MGTQQVDLATDPVNEYDRLVGSLTQDLDNAVGDWMTNEEDTLKFASPEERVSITATAIGQLQRHLGIKSLLDPADPPKPGAQTDFERFWRLSQAQHLADEYYQRLRNQPSGVDHGRDFDMAKADALRGAVLMMIRSPLQDTVRVLRDRNDAIPNLSDAGQVDWYYLGYRAGNETAIHILTGGV